MSRLLDSLRPQLGPGDQVVIVGDGAVVDVADMHCVTIAGPNNDYGATARTAGLAHATGQYVLYAGVKDRYRPGALALVREAVVGEQGLVLFRTSRNGDDNDLVWLDPELRPGNLYPSCIVHPRLPGGPNWLGRYGSAYHYVEALLRDLTEVGWDERVLVDRVTT